MSAALVTLSEGTPCVSPGTGVVSALSARKGPSLAEGALRPGGGPVPTAPAPSVTPGPRSGGSSRRAGLTLGPREAKSSPEVQFQDSAGTIAVGGQERQPLALSPSAEPPLSSTVLRERAKRSQGHRRSAAERALPSR